MNFPIFCHLKVMEDDQEIGAYMFRRTVPSMHLTSEDIRWMVCSPSIYVIQNCIFFSLQDYV